MMGSREGTTIGVPEGYDVNERTTSDCKYVKLVDWHIPAKHFP